MLNVVKKNDESHWAILSVARFFLASVVVLGHYALYTHADPLHLFGGGYFNPLSAVFGFFVLSGYSIGASLNKGHPGFYFRRFVRIWPLYIAALAYSMLLGLMLSLPYTWPLGGDITMNARDFIFSAFMLQNMFAVGSPAMIGVIWSLAVEWWLYMIAPALHRATSKNLAILTIVSFAFFIVVHKNIPNIAAVEGWSDALHSKALLGLAWIWIIGFVYFRYEASAWGYFILIGPAFIAVSFGRSVGNPYFFTVLAILVSREFNIPSRIRAFCNVLGDISYPLYLFHFPTLILLAAVGVRHRSVAFIACICVATVFLYTVDYPARKVMRKVSGMFMRASA